MILRGVSARRGYRPIWMALAARMFPADELQSARAAMLLSWLLLDAGILLGPTRPTARTLEKTAFYR